MIGRAPLRLETGPLTLLPRLPFVIPTSANCLSRSSVGTLRNYVSVDYGGYPGGYLPCNMQSRISPEPLKTNQVSSLAPCEQLS